MKHSNTFILTNKISLDILFHSSVRCQTILTPLCFSQKLRLYHLWILQHRVTSQSQAYNPISCPDALPPPPWPLNTLFPVGWVSLPDICCNYSPPIHKTGWCLLICSRIAYAQEGVKYLVSLSVCVYVSLSVCARGRGWEHLKWFSWDPETLLVLLPHESHRWICIMRQ